jgi:ubiquinone/menaquinone biosynthesis C-methylase UbiE
MDRAAIPTEERISQLLKELGIRRAHFAGRMPSDWGALAASHPDVMAAFILVAPAALAPQMVTSIASKLLIFTGDSGTFAQSVHENAQQLPGAQTALLPGFSNLGWLDVTADYCNEMVEAIFQFLPRHDASAEWIDGPPKAGRGEIAGITYRIQGSGPPLILLPLFLAPSQWEPLVPRLSERYCTIVLGGAALGAVEVLEARGRAQGYLRMMQALIDEARLQPGEKVLEVGCGTGVLGRWLATGTEARNPYIGLDINPYLLREAADLLETFKDPHVIEFTEGSGEDLPFEDDSFDLTMSITVIEEVNADRMLSELARVTRPGGRVAVVARAMDLPLFVNAPLSEALKAKVETPGIVGTVAQEGCADASLYQRLRQLSLTDLRTFPQHPVFDMSDSSVVNFVQGSLLGKLTPEEGDAWRSARMTAEQDQSFFLTWPHHCAIGTKC